MSKYISFTYFIPLIFTTYFLIYMIRIYQNDIIAFDEFVLEKQANYAADAAIEELLFTGHLGQDYNVGDYIAIEPDLSVDEFASMIAMDFGMVNTSQSMQYVKDHYIKALIVCGYDGYYAYWYQPVESRDRVDFNTSIDGHEIDGKRESATGYSFRGTPKIPYFYNKDGVQYCLTLGMTEGYSDIDAMGEDYNMVSYGPLNNISEDEARTSINNTVSNILNYALYNSYAAGARPDKTYSIPNLASEVSGKQPVDRITVLGVVEGQASALTTPVTAECIGGARIIQTDNIICFTKDNRKYYIKSSEAQTQGLSLADLSSYHATVVSTVFEAAAAGYSDYLANHKMKDLR